MDILNNVVSSGIIGGLVYFLLKVYVGKKLENVATEEDIGGITKAVESIKTDFQKDIEKLKQELAVLTNKRNVLFNEEKEAIVSYLSIWNVWFSNLKSAADFHKVSDFQTVRDTIEKYNTGFDNVQMAMSKLELFLNDNEILAKAGIININTYEIQKKATENIKAIYNCFNKTETLKKEDATDEEIGKVYAELLEKIKEYTTTIPPMFMEVNTMRSEFVQLCRVYIRKDIK